LTLITKKVEGEEAVKRFLKEVGPEYLLPEKLRALRDAFIAKIRRGEVVDSGRRRPWPDGKFEIVWVRADGLQVIWSWVVYEHRGKTL
jgi:hypothetical protein